MKFKTNILRTAGWFDTNGKPWEIPRILDLLFIVLTFSLQPEIGHRPHSTTNIIDYTNY